MLKYVKGQPNSVDIDEDHFQQPHLDVEEDQSPEKEHWANQNASSAGALGKAPTNSDWNLWNGSCSWFSTPATWWWFPYLGSFLGSENPIPLIAILFSKRILHCK